MLLEVLVSVVAIAVGLVYIVQSFSMSTRAIAASRRYLKAVSHLEEKLWDLEAARKIKSGKDEDVFEDDREFRWLVEAETEEETPLNKTRLEVSWTDRGRKQRVSATTYLWNEED